MEPKSSWVTGAFRSSGGDEAFFFMQKKSLVDEYIPGKAEDHISKGPTQIGDVFPCLKGTIFETNGVHGAFGSKDEGEAFIFSSNTCAKISISGTQKIIIGPIPIAQMFPFFKGTMFESGIDAAFESTIEDEAYLFKGDQYACINYGPKPQLIVLSGLITGWPCLKGTLFETGIGACFASHFDNEVYLFKEDSCALLKFTPDPNNDTLIGGVKKIKDYWPALGSILPVSN